MEAKVLNYRIIVEPDKRVGTNQDCYSASCPTLGISISADSIDDALVDIKKAIQLWVDTLVEDNQPVPLDFPDQSVVTYTSVKAPKRMRAQL